MTPITRAEATTAFYGAWRLFLRDPKGLGYFRDDTRSLFQSFQVAAIVLPGYFLLRFAVDPDIWAGIPLLRAVVVEAAAYSMMWTVWPLAMLVFARMLQKDERYTIYIIAQNWMTGPVILLYLVVLSVGTGVGASPETVRFMAFVTSIWVLVYHAFIIRTALKVAMAPTIGLVIADFFLGEVIMGVRSTMLYGG